MKLIPKSTFGRIALMLAVLLLVNQIFSYFTVSFYVIKPHIHQVMHLLGTQVKVVFMEGAEHLPKSVQQNFAEATQIRLFSTERGIPEGLRNATRYESLTREMAKTLGEGTEVRVEESEAFYFWIKAPQHPHVWVRIPMPQFEHVYPPPALLTLAFITLLSLLGGWAVARHLSRPLKRLEFAAREIGRGDHPGRLKEEGSQELVAVTQAFNQMARDVQQLEEDRTLLLAGISHDLRTPLTRIRLASEFLPDSESDVRDGIVRDTEDMDAIINQFISFVRDGRDEGLDEEDLNELVRETADAASLGKEPIEVRTGELPLLRFRPLAIKRLIANLLQNAQRYGAPPIVVETAMEGNYARVSVLDQGPGVKEEELERLFQPFSRGDSARGGRGSGLGLAIVKRIAEMHHGQVSLSNRPEGGAEARLLLPLQLVDKPHQRHQGWGL